ncbi:PREDICTED: uncharacterized protein LOC107069899 isoform X2 [Polistes dominula]|uniref:Uncharacterized protein LOC107069899 isoform X2 n=1 Tax=Polistes dominula TaxID=743375 RepID=A0ABM1ISA2_POLDO|nr:PREDICTED: uncharacterized protein LOC107069899 isoform X2 [Polistes dominula]
MKDKKKSRNKNKMKRSTKSRRTVRSTRNKRPVKCKRLGLNTVKHCTDTENNRLYKKVDSHTIKIPCKQVFVVIENLSSKIIDKYVRNSKNQSKQEISETGDIQLQNSKQPSISEKLPTEKKQPNDNVSYIFDNNTRTHSDVNNTTVNLTNTINIKDKLKRKRMHADFKMAEMEIEENICVREVKKRCALSIKRIYEESRRTKRMSELSCGSIEQTTVLNNLNSTDNKITRNNSNLYAQNTNIADAKVILTRLENMHNTYVTNWKNKCAQQALLSTNLESTISHEDISINTLPIETIDNYHRNDIEDSDNYMNEENDLNICTLQSKCEQHLIPKVHLMKLKTLENVYKIPNSFSKIISSTAENFDNFELKVNHSSNVFNRDNEVNFDSLNIQSEENQLCAFEITGTCFESIERLENPEIHKPLICEEEKRPTLPENVSIDRSICTANVQKCLERSSEKSTKEVISDEMSEINSELKKIETSPSIITEQNTSLNANNVIPKNEIIYEDLQIPQSKEITIIDNNEETIIIDNKEKLVIINMHQELNNKKNSYSDEIKEENSIAKLPENVHTNQQETQRIIHCKCFSCMSLIVNENIQEVSNYNKTQKSNLQEKSYDLDNNSTESLTSVNISSLSSTISKDNMNKRCHENENKDKDELSCNKIFKNNHNNLKCNICSKVFDSEINLLNHLYIHTNQKQLQIKYEGNNKNQNCNNINVSSRDDETDLIVLNEEIETGNNMTVESLYPYNANYESMTNEITSRLQQNISEKNDLKISTIEPDKEDKLIKNSIVDEKLSFKYCTCHEKEFEKVTSMVLVLYCNICNVLYHNIDCFKTHLNEKLYTCNDKKLTTKMSKLYCNICKTMLSDFQEMRKHMEYHLIHFKSIKLFCHICKIRFIGMGRLFFQHWLHHEVDIFYKASISEFPTIAIVKTVTKEWSIITSDEFKYLIITEHVCNNCKVQCFSTNELKKHLLFCQKKGKLINIRLLKHHRDSVIADVQSELDVPTKIDKISVSNKSYNFTCKICSDTFENLRKLVIHLENYHGSFVNFTCNQCEQRYNDLIKYLGHLDNCIKADDTIKNTYHEKKFVCKICNIIFDSRRGLHLHNTLFKNKVLHLSTTEQIKEDDSVGPINESISEVPKTPNSVVKQLIDTPTNLSFEKPRVNTYKVNNDSDKNDKEKDLNGKRTTVIIQLTNSKQKSVLDKNTESSKIINITEKNDEITLIEPEIPQKNQKESYENNDEVTLIESEILRENQKKSNRKSNKNTSSEPKLSQENQKKSNKKNDEIPLIEPEIPQNNQKDSHENSWEDVEETSNDLLNYSTPSSSKHLAKDLLNYSTSPSNKDLANANKFLRVRNILELVEQPSKYSNYFIELNRSTDTSKSSSIARNSSLQKYTGKVKASTLSSETARQLAARAPKPPSIEPSRVLPRKIPSKAGKLPSTASKLVSILPKPPSTAPKLPSTVSKPPLTAPKLPSTASKPPLTAPKQPLTAPELTSTTPILVPVAQKLPSTAPKPPSTVSTLVSIAPKPPSTAPKLSSTASKPPLTAPKLPSTAPKTLLTKPVLIPIARKLPSIALKPPSTASTLPSIAPKPPSTASRLVSTAPKPLSTASILVSIAPTLPSTAPKPQSTASTLVSIAPKPPLPAPIIVPTTTIPIQETRQIPVQQVATIVEPQPIEIQNMLLPEITIIQKNKFEKPVSIGAPQSGQTSLPMQTVPCREPCSTQPKISNIQNQSIRSVENEYLMNHKSAATNNFRINIENPVSIGAPQSGQTSLPMQTVPCREPCSTQPKISNIQNQSIRSVENEYLMNHKSAATNNFGINIGKSVLKGAPQSGKTSLPMQTVPCREPCLTQPKISNIQNRNIRPVENDYLMNYKSAATNNFGINIEKPVSIGAPQSGQTPLPMQTVPCKEPCSTQPKVSYIQNRSRRLVENDYLVNHKSAATNNFGVNIEQQSQNIMIDSGLTDPQLSTNFITNNYQNITIAIPGNNNKCGKTASASTASIPIASASASTSASTASIPVVSASASTASIPIVSASASASTASIPKVSACASASTAFIPTASTSTAMNSQFKSYIAETKSRSKKHRNTHVLVMQSPDHDYTSNTVAEGNSADIRPENGVTTNMNNGASIYPVSSNKSNNYDTTNGKFFVNKILTTMKTKNINTIKETKNNNDLSNIVNDTNQQQPNGKKVATICGKSNVISKFEKFLQLFPTLRFQLICNYCPDSSKRFTREEYDIHMKSKHNFVCNLCNSCLHTLSDLQKHKKKHTVNS